MASPPVTILILGYNNRTKLVECLHSLEKTDYPNYNVVLVDNNSTDDSVAHVEKKFPAVKIVRLKKNYGFIAYNYVVPEVDTEYIVLINNDIVVDKEWLKHLMPYILADDVAQVVPKLLLYDDRSQINAAGGMIDIFGVAWNRGNGEIDQGQYDTVEEVFYGVGAVTLFKKSVWSKISGFDTRYFMTAEDVDWSWRARLAGYKIVYVPQAIAYHHWLSSIGRSDYLFYMAEKNQIANLLKNYEKRTLLKLLPALLTIKLMKIIYLALVRRDFRLALVTLRAIIWNLANLKQTLEKRREVNALRKVPDRALHSLMHNTSFEICLGLGKMRHPAVDSLLKR